MIYLEDRDAMLLGLLAKNPERHEIIVKRLSNSSSKKIADAIANKSKSKSKEVIALAKSIVKWAEYSKGL